MKVYWITGLAGAGKTTIGKLLFQEIKDQYNNTVFLDGDTLREVFGNDLGYSTEDRFKSAMRYSRLSKLMVDQGINVVIATISMFDECRAWNRENIEGYYEIYLKVPQEILFERDQKNLYSSLGLGEHNVVGVGMGFEEPKSPDLVIENDGSIEPKEIINIILNNGVDKYEAR